LALRFYKWGSHGDDFDHEIEENAFDNDTNMWLLAAGLYLEGLQWLERDVGREDAGYAWLSSSRAMDTLRRMSENDPTMTTLYVMEQQHRRCWRQCPGGCAQGE
jgi:hypothetical protein